MEARRQKGSLEAQLADLDALAGGSGLSKSDWAIRYALEDALMQLHQQAEIYWRQRGTLNWTLKGDAPTAYFFAIANGRRRRCSIDSLLINGIKTSDQSQILAHVVEFFSSLLAAKPESGLLVASSLWDTPSRISREENDTLMLPLSDEEIWEVIKSANPNAASGPDGFSIPFFKRFWTRL